MIRQTITCDTCGIERKQANHWFEAFEHEGELRIRGLVVTKTTRPGLKHLCGQTCLHRLVDDFLAGNLASRMFGTQEETRAPSDFAQIATLAQTSLEASDSLDFGSSARLIETPISQKPPRPRLATRKTPAVQTRASKPESQTAATVGATPERLMPKVAPASGQT